jgi:inner membrane protein
VDNLTHTLTGVALAQSGLSRASRGASIALVLASNIPDVDMLFGLQGTASYLQHHRDLSHSVVGAPLLALGLALGFRLALRGSRFVGLFVAALAGVAGHVLMDLWTSYGTRVRAESEVATIFLAFSRFPWLEVEETTDGTAVTWRDLRFERPGRDSFVTRVVVGRDGRIRSQAFRF